MVGSIIKWKVSNKAISEWTCLCLLLLMFMIGVKSFYLHHAESSLEVHSLTIYISASNSFKCNFWIYVFETWHLTLVCSSVQVLCKEGFLGTTVQWYISRVVQISSLTQLNAHVSNCLDTFANILILLNIKFQNWGDVTPPVMEHAFCREKKFVEDLFSRKRTFQALICYNVL